MGEAILSNPTVNQAIEALRGIIDGVRANIERVMLFGSIIEKTPQEAQDVDFLIAYTGTDFQSIRQRLLSVPIGRRVVVEDVEAQYANHPKWPREDPLAIHIILYRQGLSKLSEKLEGTRRDALDISQTFLS